MDRERANAYVSELGQALGIAGLALDDRGGCTLAIDDGAVIVNLGHSQSARSIDLKIVLDKVEPSRLQLRRVLLANFGGIATGGATFALDPIGGALVLQSRCTASVLERGGLRAAMESIVAAAEGWSKRLAELAETDKAGGHPVDPAVGMPGSGALRP